MSHRDVEKLPVVAHVTKSEGVTQVEDLDGNTHIVKRGDPLHYGEALQVINGSVQITTPKFALYDINTHEKIVLDSRQPFVGEYYDKYETAKSVHPNVVAQESDTPEEDINSSALETHDLDHGTSHYVLLAPEYRSGEVTSGFDTEAVHIVSPELEEEQPLNVIPENNVHHGEPGHNEPIDFNTALGVDESIGDDEQGGLPNNIGFDQISLAQILSVNNSPINAQQANFSLSILNPNSGLFDVASGQEIILKYQGSTVIGEANGELVFEINLDSTTRVLDLNLFRAIEHPDSLNPDDVVVLGGNILQLNVGYEDFCGIVVSDAIDLCDWIQFKDDGPCICIPEVFQNFHIVIDESSGDDEEGGLSNNIGFGEIFGYQLFDVLPGSDGLAEENYRLNIISEQSSLIDALSGKPVVFQFDADAVIGVAGDEVVIRFDINPDTGDVHINLFRAIVHPDADTPDDAFLVGPELLEVIAEAIDNDGDMVWEQRDLGNMIVIEDDGPIVDSDNERKNVDNRTLSIANSDNEKNGEDENGVARVGDKDRDENASISNGESGKDSDHNKSYDISDSVDEKDNDINTSSDSTKDNGNNTNLLRDTHEISVHRSAESAIDARSSILNTNSDAIEAPIVQAAFTTEVHNPVGDITTYQNFTDIVGEENPETDLDDLGCITLPADEFNESHIQLEAADLFNVSSGNDGLLSQSYSLTFQENQPTGLTSLNTGEEIVFVASGESVLGQTLGDGRTVFQIDINAQTGTVYLQEFIPVTPDPNNPDGSITLQNNLLGVELVVIDNDGDSAEASVDIGQHIMIEFTQCPNRIFLEVDETLGDDEVGGIINSIGHASTSMTNLLNNSGVSISDLLLATTDYTFNVTDTQTNLVDSQTGEAIVITVDENGIYGVTVDTQTQVFSVTIEPTTQELSFNLFRGITHPDANDPNDSLSLEANLGEIQYQITDTNGTSHDGTVNLSEILRVAILDDGPTISIDSIAGITIDESQGDDENGGLPNNIGFAQLEAAQGFTVSAGNDGLSSQVYSLTFEENQFTGLTDSESGEEIILVANGDSVVGQTFQSGLAVFQVDINSETGLIDFNLFRALVHPDTSDPDDGITLGNNLLGVHLVVTDNDGDSAQETVDIGQHITIEDDGPSIDVPPTVQDPILLQVDETLGDDEVGETIHNIGHASVSMTNLLNQSGVSISNLSLANTNYTFNLTNTQTNLVDSQTGEVIVLTGDFNGIYGVTADTQTQVFSIVIDTTTQDLSFNLFRGITHPDTNDPNDSLLLGADLGEIQYQITDTNGTSYEGTINLSEAINVTVFDDAPTIYIDRVADARVNVEQAVFNTPEGGVILGPATASVSGDTLFILDTNAGSDGFEDVNYALDILEANTTLVMTDTQVPIMLELKNNIVFGISDDTAVFSIAVDETTGQLTVNQFLAFTNMNDSDNVLQLGNNHIQLHAAITDADGDTSQSSVDLGNMITFLEELDVLPPQSPTPPRGITLNENIEIFLDESGSLQAPFNFDGTISSSYLQPQELFSISDDLTVTDFSFNLLTHQTNLIDTQTGLPIALQLYNGSIIGTPWDFSTPFTPVEAPVPIFNSVIRIDPFFPSPLGEPGIATWLFNPVHHPDSQDPNDTVSFDSNIIELVVTLSDGERKTTEHTFDLGEIITIADHAPTFDISAIEGSVLLLPEIVGEADGTELGFIQANVTDMFNINHTDNTEQSNNQPESFQYALSIINASTPLHDALTGQKINLVDNTQQSPGNIYSAVSGVNENGDTVFTIVIHDGSGSITFSQFRPIESLASDNDAVNILGENHIQLEVSFTDGDGDIGTEIIDFGNSIIFLDDSTFLTSEAVTDSSALSIIAHTSGIRDTLNDDETMSKKELDTDLSDLDKLQRLSELALQSDNDLLLGPSDSLALSGPLDESEPIEEQAFDQPLSSFNEIKDSLEDKLRSLRISISNAEDSETIKEVDGTLLNDNQFDVELLDFDDNEESLAELLNEVSFEDTTNEDIVELAPTSNNSQNTMDNFDTMLDPNSTISELPELMQVVDVI